MKRFMLVSLMSCMLVGQVSCEWSWSDYGKGLKTAVIHTGIVAGLGAIAGAVLGNTPGESTCESRKKLFSMSALCAGITGISAAGMTAQAAADDRKSGSVNNSELMGRRTPFAACILSTIAALVGYGFYTAYQPPAC